MPLSLSRSREVENNRTKSNRQDTYNMQASGKNPVNQNADVSSQRIYLGPFIAYLTTLSVTQTTITSTGRMVHEY